jgi:hypothetical protein
VKAARDWALITGIVLGFWLIVFLLLWGFLRVSENAMAVAFSARATWEQILSALERPAPFWLVLIVWLNATRRRK